MRLLLALLLVSLTAPSVAQTTTPAAPVPKGMRLIVSTDGSIPRNAPAFNATCGADNHVCSGADAQAPGVYAVIDNVNAVLDAGGGFYWQRATFATGAAGWVRPFPPFMSMLSPPQMIAGIPFTIAADYGPGPVLLQASCIKDGVSSPATLQLTATTCCSDNGPGHKGMLLCPWPNAGIANHIVVIAATNSQGTTPSAEFQFSVTAAPVIPTPSTPSNLRIRAPGATTTTSN